MNLYAWFTRLVFCTLLFVSINHSFAIELAQYVNQAEKLPRAPLIDRDVFLNKPAIKQVVLSPSGDFVIYQKAEGLQEKKLVSVWRYDIKTKVHKRLFTYQSLQGIYLSKRGDKLILNTGNSIAVADTSQPNSPVVLTEYDKTKYENWLGFAADDDHSLLMRKWQASDKYFYVERVSFSGQKTDIYRSTELFNGFNVDQEGKPAYVRIFNQAENNQGEHFIYQLDNNKKTLRFTCQWDDPCSVVAFNRQTGAFILKTNANQNLAYLARLSNQGELQAIHQDPKNYGDLSDVLLVNHQAMIAKYHGEYDRYYAINDKMSQHLQWLTKHFKQQSFFLQVPKQLSIQRQLSQGMWLITSLSNSAQKKHFLYDLNRQKLMPVLTEVSTKANKSQTLVKDEHLAPRVSIHYRSRDGQTIQAYLTLPRGKNISNSPLVALPHGGPWSRDNGEFDMTAQFLANRGYIVLQPNFRASTGFGKLHHSGVSGDFGYGRTHFDIVDGINYLLMNNIGDKEKLAIAGHSFGGFSALTALTFEPDLFKVAFAGAPPSHIGRSAKYYYRYQKKKFGQSRKYFMQHLVVDWHDEQAFNTLSARQPETHIQKLKSPLMIWAGKHDGRVFITDVKNYALTAQAHNKNIQLFVDPNAAHSPSSRVAFNAYLFLMEATLGHYLQQPVEPVSDTKNKALYRFIKQNIVLASEIYLSQYLH